MDAARARVKSALDTLASELFAVSASEYEEAIAEVGGALPMLVALLGAGADSKAAGNAARTLFNLAIGSGTRAAERRPQVVTECRVP